MEFQSFHDSIHRDNLLVASLIATLYRMRSKPDPFIQWLLAQHVLHETHQYMLRLLQDEVFGHLRHKLEAEHQRTRLLQHWILPKQDEREPEEWRLDLFGVVGACRPARAQGITDLSTVVLRYYSTF